MKRNRIILSGVAVAGFVCGAALYAQRPVENIDPHRHPNLAEAQHHIMEAWGKTEEARKDNKDNLGGHAEKALHSLEEADRELKAAAEFADHRK
jgi:hypothetical protein